MSQDNNRRKLKPNRYNKFEASENPAKDLDTYTDIPRRPQKRLSNDLSQTFNEPQTPEPSRKTIYKNLEKWASPNSNDSAGYSANQRLRRLKTVINESVTDTVKPKFNDSSGTPQKSVQETIVPKSSAEKSIPSPYSTSLPKTPQITSPDSASNSPYKINCKRKNSESTPNEDEYKSWKKYLVSPKTPVENAEPDEDFPDTQQQPVESKPANKNVETQTQEAKVEDNDKYLCIVVDTNIFISDLTKVNDIVNLKVTGPMKPIVYIPWMVVTELDEMKDRSGNNSLKQNVYNAIKCINKWLSEENPRVKGQTIIDMGKQMHVGSSQDDKIIGTCLQANDTYESVILLSNDINLKNKAMINGIAVASGNEIIMKIMSKVSKNTKYQKILQKMSMLCSSIICECAKEAYGDVWLKMDMLSNPPWSLAECLKRFKKYWVAVFQEKLMKQFLNTVDKLQMLFDTTTHFCDDSDKYIEFVKLSLNICIFLKDIEEYRGSIENTINDITNIG